MAVDIGTLRGLLVLDDKFSAKLDIAARKLETTGKKWEQVGAQLNAVGGSLTRSITLPLGAAAAAALTLSTKFETSLTKIETLVGIAGSEVDGFRDSVLQLAGETAKAPKELADALFVVTSAGARGATALEILERAAKASAAGLGDTTEIARAVTAAIAAYGEENLSASRATDILVATVREGNLEASELAGSLGRVIGIASQVGVSFEQLGGFVATFTRLGVNAEEAITALRGVLNASIAPSEGARKGLEELGLSAEELRRTIKEDGLDAALRDLVKRADGNTEAIAKVIPNVRALSGVLGTAGAQGQVFADINKRISNSLGILDEAFGRVTETKGFKFQQFLSDLQAVGIRLGDALAPALEKILAAGTRVLVWATKAVDLFAALPSPIQSVALALFGITLVAGPLLLFIGQLAITIGVVTGKMALLTAATTVNTAATFRNSAAHAGQATAMLTSSSRLGKLINLFPSFLTKMVQSRTATGQFTKSFKVLDLSILKTQFTFKTLTTTVIGGLKAALLATAAAIKTGVIVAFVALKAAAIAAFAVIAAHPFIALLVVLAAVTAWGVREGGFIFNAFVESAADGAGSIKELRAEWDKFGTSLEERRASVQFLTEANTRLTEAVAAGVAGATEAQAILRDQIALGEPAEIALGKIAAKTNENTDASRLLKGVLIETSTSMNGAARAAAELAKTEEATAASAAAAEAAHAELVKVLGSLGVVTKVEALAGIRDVTTALESGLVPPEQMTAIIDELATQYEDLGLRGIPDVEAALLRLNKKYETTNGILDTQISKQARLAQMLENQPPFIDDVGLSLKDMASNWDDVGLSVSKAGPPFRAASDVLNDLGIKIPDIDKKLTELTTAVASGDAPVRQLVEAIRRQRSEYERLGVLTPDLNKKLNELERTALMNATAADKAALGFQGLFDGFRTGIPEVDKLLGKFSGFLGIFKSIGGALGGLGSKFGSFFSKLAGKVSGLFGAPGGGGGGGSIFGGIFSSIKGMFGGGSKGEQVLNVAATDASDVMSALMGGSSGLAKAGVEGAGGFLGGLSGILGSVASFAPIIGPLLAAFGGPLLKGLKALGGKLIGVFKGLFGGPDAAELAGRSAAAAFRDSVRNELSADVLADVMLQFPNQVENAAFLASIQQKLIAVGVAAEAAGAQARQWGIKLFEAEKQGGDAVQRVIDQIGAATQATIDAVEKSVDATAKAQDAVVKNTSTTAAATQAIVEASASNQVAVANKLRDDKIAALQAVMQNAQMSNNTMIADATLTSDTIIRTWTTGLRMVEDQLMDVSKTGGRAFESIADAADVASRNAVQRFERMRNELVGQSVITDTVDKANKQILTIGDAAEEAARNAELAFGGRNTSSGGFMGDAGGGTQANFAGFGGDSRSQPRFTDGARGSGGGGRNVDVIQLVVDGVVLTEIVLRNQSRVLANKGLGRG